MEFISDRAGINPRLESMVLSVGNWRSCRSWAVHPSGRRGRASGRRLVASRLCRAVPSPRAYRISRWSRGGRSERWKGQWQLSVAVDASTARSKSPRVSGASIYTSSRARSGKPLTRPVCVSVGGVSTFQVGPQCRPLYHRVVSTSAHRSRLTTIRRVAVGLRSRAAGRRLVVAASRLPRPRASRVAHPAPAACCTPARARPVIASRQVRGPHSLTPPRFRHVEPVQQPLVFLFPGASVAPCFSRGRSAPSRVGRSRNVVMAGTSRRPSSELGPDLSSPTPPKKSKFSESSVEGPSGKEHDLSTEELESVEKLASSVAASLPGKTIELIPRGETSPFEISEESLDSTKQLIQTSLEGPAKVTAGSSKEGHFGGFETIVQMKYSGQEELSGGPSKRPEADSDLQIQTSLLGEDASYQELSLIGNGAYGTVYKAKDLNTGQVVALKKVRVPLTDDGLPTSTLREIATLKQLERFEHPHIVRLLDVCQGNYLHLPSADGRSERLDRGLTLWLVFEHVERDLASFISSCPRPGIPSHTVKQMSREILKGVEFLHSHRIIHRDLKPQNLLVSKEGRIKIADFGLAKTYDFEMRLTSVVVTQWYRAPEVLLGCSYATPVDIWSVGCILAELCRLEPLYPGTSEGDQLDRIFQIIGTPSQEEWPENVSLSWTAFPYRQPKPLAAIIPDLNEDGLELIKNLLMFDPHSRLTAAQALRHRYFTEDDS